MRLVGIALLIAGLGLAQSKDDLTLDEARTASYQKLIFAKQRSDKALADFLSSEQKKCAESGGGREVKNLIMAPEGIVRCQVVPPTAPAKPVEEKK